jgi:transitional endoplasmic reticulum ATPase
MVELSKDATGDELKEARRATAAKLLELAKDCERAKEQNRKGSGVRVQGSAKGEKSEEAEGESTAENWIVKEKPKLRFTDVAGLDAVKEDIRLKMVYPFEHPELAQRFGIRGGGGVLLYGPPGTGKTMLAKATAGELDATFFRVSPAEMLSKWVGEAEQNIKKLFDAAQAERRSVIFIDEIEALIPARRDEGSSVMQRVVPQILQGMEGFDNQKEVRAVLFMGATNVPWQLDPAVLRPGRFDEKVYIPLPDLAARRKMLDIYLGKRPLAEDLDLDALARNLEGMSGADIKYVCDRSATIPFLRSVATGQEGPITAEILTDVIQATPRSVTEEMLKRFEAWGREMATA